MCEEGVAHRSVSVLVGESRGPPVEEEGHKEYYRVFPVLGILLNLAALVGIGLILYLGSSL